MSATWQNGSVTTPEHPSDPPLRMLDLPSGPLACADVGEGPALLLLHGAPGSARDWRWLAPGLEGRLRLIRLELPGFGDSPLATMPDPSIDARASLVVEAAEALGLDRFVVLGHSQGGAVALRVAARFPERVAGLALLASVAGRPHRPIRNSMNLAPIGRLLRWPATRWLAMPLLRRGWAKLGFPSSTPRDAMVQSLHWTVALDFEAIGRDIAALGAGSLPTLVAWADDDRLVERAISVELAAALPDGPRLTFEQGGHNLQKTCAVELAEGLAGFVGSVAG